MIFRFYETGDSRPIYGSIAPTEERKTQANQTLCKSTPIKSITKFLIPPTTATYYPPLAKPKQTPKASPLPP